MSRRRSRSNSPRGRSRSCSSNDARDLERRVFVGNLPTSDMDRKDLEDMFSPYGKIVGVSMFRGFGFVQFDRIEEAESAKAGYKGRIYKGYKIDVNMATERRHPKPQPRQSPPRRGPYGGYGDSKDGHSRSPMYGRDARDSRDGRDPRPAGHPRDHEDRYRSGEGRDKDLRGGPRGDPRDPGFREDYGRYYRGGSGGEDLYRKKEDPYRDPWNGRREPEDDRVRPEERWRNELYRQYYEELQRRYDTERPVDCSVIVVNKAQKEYAETVGRKVRDLGMVVDLIFLNTEVSLTQALEDVGRARTPFAIIITQQHQVHHSCTVNILFGTPQEHRNMPMQDAMVLVAHNYDAYKAEQLNKDREEIARKAAKMADDVLLREPDRESHPVSMLTTITLLTENRFITPEELDTLIAYLKDKRTRMVGSSTEPIAATSHPPPTVASHHESLPPSSAIPPSHAPQPSHMGLTPVSNSPSNPNHQQELQAKILSLFNSGSGASVGAVPASSSMTAQTQVYGSMGSGLQSSGMSLPSSQNPAPSSNSQMMGVRPTMAQGVPLGASQGYSIPAGRGAATSSSQRLPSSASGINFDNPSVQKALDTLIQSGPSLNHLVSSVTPPQQQQQQPLRPGPSMDQGPPMSMYPRHY